MTKMLSAIVTTMAANGIMIAADALARLFLYQSLNSTAANTSELFWEATVRLFTIAQTVPANQAA